MTSCRRDFAPKGLETTSLKGGKHFEAREQICQRRITDIMAESSSAGPLNGEALRLIEPAIRFLPPCAKHVKVNQGLAISSESCGSSEMCVVRKCGLLTLVSYQVV